MSIKKITKRSSCEILDDLKRIAGLGKDYQLAELLGVKQNTVSAWRTRNTIPYEEIIAFCDKYALSVSGLLKGSEEPTVRETKEKYKGAIKIDLIKEVIGAVEEIFEKEKLCLPPRKKADLIILLCEEVAENESNKKNLGEKILKLTRFAS